MTNAQITEIVADYQSGATLRELGKRHGVSHVRIQRLLEAQGVERRSGGRRQITSLSERKCWKCQVVKEISLFMRSKRQPSGYEYTCKSCRKQLNRRHSLKKTYGITVEQYAEMLAVQDGCCAICKRSESRTRGSRAITLAVDHCHSSGSVRGLLCGRCNTAIGLLQDDVGVLRQAIEYLEGFKAKGSPIEKLPNKAMQRTRDKIGPDGKSKVASR
jgi:hypothetical protein